ncbi:MAG TPA: hypothetical protein VM933_00100, partial [Acidimicrobiales bacterium]|nr:hypothetical protein [Acidimicrobiales bacterium]
FRPALLTPISVADVLSAFPALALAAAVGASILLLSRRDRRAALRTFRLAFALRAGMAVVLAFSFQFDDEAGLHAFAGGAGSSGGYVVVLGWLYAVFGVNLMVAKALNVLLGSLLVVVVADLVAHRAEQRVARWIALVCPPLVIYAAVNLKETGTALLLVLGLAAVVRALHQDISIPRAALYGASCGGALWFLRGAAWAGLVGLALAGGLAFELIASRRGRDRRRLLLIVPVFLVAVGFAGPALARTVRTEYVAQRVGNDRVTSYYVDRTYATGSGVTGYLDTGDPLGARNLALLWGRGLFVPSPFRALTAPSSPRTVELAGTVGWYAVVFLGARGAARDWRSRGTPLLVGAALLLSFSTASLSSLGADPARHRLVVIPLLCALAAKSAGPRPPGGLVRLVPYGVLLGAALYNGLWVLAFARGGVGA